VLWVLAAKGYSYYVGLGLIIGGLTDALDGYLARRFDLTSKFGSQFDSLADHILGTSAIVWLLMLEPAVFQDNTVIFLIAVFLYLVRMVVGWVKFKRIANLHLYSGKVYGGIQIVFLAHTFLFEGYNRTLFFIMVSVFIISIIEGLILMFTRDRVDEHMGSVILVYLRKKRTVDSVD
jgi:phosphatidylglycerophosphate synthase